jgi:diguanylate cyclase (GGDEF)-like protein
MLSARLIGSLSVLLQAAGLALVLGIWTAVRQSSRRRRFDAWWIGMWALDIGLFALVVGLGLGIVGFFPIPADEFTPRPFVALWLTLEYVSAAYIYVGTCRICRVRPHPRTRTIVVAVVVVTLATAALPVPFRYNYGLHSVLLGTSYLIAARILFAALPRMRGTGLRIVTGSLAALATLFYAHVPIVFSANFTILTSTSFGGTYVAANEYLTLLVELILAVGMLVAEIDRVQSALHVANARLLAAQTRLSDLVHTDALTGLRNRAALERAFATAHFTTGYVVCLDLDGLKAINDRHGHPVGDRAIRTFAEAIRTCAESSDDAFRIGGDEFVLVYAAESEREIVIRLEAMQRNLRIALDDGRELAMMASFGIARFDRSTELAIAIALADARLYAHKARAR